MTRPEAAIRVDDLNGSNPSQTGHTEAAFGELAVVNSRDPNMEDRMKGNILTTVLTTGLLVVSRSVVMAGDAPLQTFQAWSDRTNTVAVARPRV